MDQKWCLTHVWRTPYRFIHIMSGPVYSTVLASSIERVYFREALCNTIPCLSYRPIKMRQVSDVHCYLAQLCVNTPLLMHNTGQITSCRVYMKRAPTLHWNMTLWFMTDKSEVAKTSLHSQSWYSPWGRGFYFTIAAESFPSWDTIRAGFLFRIHKEETTTFIINSNMEFTFQVRT